MKAWFENDIQRLKREKDELKALNVSFHIDEKALEEKLLRMQLKISADNTNFDLPDKSKDIDLIAVFPDTYPYFRPAVYADDVSLPRHQNPLDKGLCLLGRPTDLWDPSMTLGQFLLQQLKQVLIKGFKTDESELKNDETEQAEPISEYFGSDVTMIMDPTIIEGYPSNGLIEHIGRIIVGMPDDNSEGSRYAVLQIKDKDGNKILSSLPESIEKIFPHRKISGVAYRLPELFSFTNPLELYEQLVEGLKKQNEKIYYHNGNGKMKSSPKEIKNIIALNFPEETSAGKKEMSGWLFLIGYNYYKSQKKNGSKQGNISYNLPKYRVLIARILI